MKHQNYLELVAFFTEDINEGHAELLESIDKKKFTIAIDYITINQTDNLTKKGYFTAIFPLNDKRIKLIIEKMFED